MLYIVFASLVLAQWVGLMGLRRRGSEGRFSVAVVALIVLAVASADLFVQRMA